MKCPRDNSELIYLHRRVYAYCCEKCEGLLLKPRSLLIIKKNFSSDTINQYFNNLQVYKPSIKCPNCLDTMKSVVMDSVEIDLCPHCNCGWFDNNEIKAIVKSHGEKTIPKNKANSGEILFQHTLIEIVVNFFGFFMY